VAYFVTDRCVGCTICAKNCPVGAISGGKKEKHVINKIRCIDCGVCGKSCPQSAILDFQGNPTMKVPMKFWEKPEISSGGCSACGLCIDICFRDCIVMTYPAFKGDTKVFARFDGYKTCVGCGICAKICPLNVIDMKREINYE
jgi:Na+-translocating ferredoxin:NAD+ oxidoreductase subunit B